MDGVSHMLRVRLAALRRLVRLAMVTVGLGRLICAAAVLGLLDFALDRAFRLPHETRLVLLCVWGAILLWQTARQVVLPLVRSLPDDALALEVEQRWRGPADLLASALHFATVGSRRSASSALRSVTIRQADSQAGRVVPATLVAWGRVRRWLLAGAAAVALVVALVALNPGRARLWFRRNVLLARVQWPRRTRLTLLELPRFVPRGADVSITVEAAGVVPRTARLKLRGTESGTSRTLLMERVGEDAFSAELTGLAETTAFTVRAGDGVLDEQRIEVVDRPAVSRARLIVTLPDYITERLVGRGAAGPVELAWRAAGFEIPKGSQATVILEASKPLSSARCRLDDAEPPSPRRMGRRSVQFAFEVDRDLSCEFTLVDTHGIESEEPFRVELRAVQDTPPQVSVFASGVGDMLVPEARVPLTVRAGDDYGADAVWLDQWYEGPDGRRDCPRVQLWDGPARIEFSAELVTELRERRLPATGRFVVAAGARDNCAVGGPNTGRSAPLSFRLVTVRELLGALLLQQQDLRRDLEQQVQRQKDIKERLQGQLGEDPVQAAPLETLEPMQRALAGVLDLTGAGYRNVLDQMLNNRVIARPNYESRLAGIVRPLEVLGGSEGAVLQAADALDQMHRDGPPAAGAASDLMAAAIGQMEQVRARMMLFESYAALVASVEEITDDQRELLRRTREQEQRSLDALWGE